MRQYQNPDRICVKAKIRLLSVSFDYAENTDFTEKE